MTRYVFTTGGVVSSLGKGIASASLAAILEARGLRIAMIKLDPYINVDPGTMSPFEHGEVFVSDDGAETDLDLGHYERFTGVAARMSDSISSNRVSVLDTGSPFALTIARTPGRSSARSASLETSPASGSSSTSIRRIPFLRVFTRASICLGDGLRPSWGSFS